MLNTQSINKVKKYKRWQTLSIYIMFVVFSIFAIRYQYLLLNYMVWGDEAETIVTAKMMFSGMKLYSEIFNHHGPLTFFTGLIVEAFGGVGVVAHRIPIAIMQFLAIVIIYKSPLIKDSVVKIFISIFISTMILLFIPNVFGHMYKYQTISGLIIMIVISLYTIPVIYNDKEVSSIKTIAGCFLISCLPFLSITFLPIAILLFLSSFKYNKLKVAFVGFFSGIIFNFTFLIYFGSVKGFIAFHLYLNSKILPIYNGNQTIIDLVFNAFNTATSDIAHFLSLLILFSSAAILAIGEKGIPWRTILLIAAIFSLLIRGGGFHGMPFLYAIFALIPVLAFRNNIVSDQSKAILSLFILIFIIKVSLLIPGDLKKIKSQKIPTGSEFSNLVKEITNSEDKIIAYSFNNFEYIWSDRLPASGHFFYLPWQEKYNENPKLGIKIDACKQIIDNKPKLMLMTKWKVWDKFSWDSYGGCIQNILDEHYIKYLDKPYYIRSDLINDYKWWVPQPSTFKMVASSAVDIKNPIEIKFTNFSDNDKKIKRIGIMLGTHIRVNPGIAKLLLIRSDGENLEIDFSLSDILDNDYKYFDVPDDLYISGSIYSVTGGGISVWESHNEKNEVYSCVKYIFSDESLITTPGCNF